MGQLIADLSMPKRRKVFWIPITAAWCIVDRHDFAAQLPYPPVDHLVFERVFAADEAQLVTEMSCRAKWNEPKHQSNYSP